MNSRTPSRAVAFVFAVLVTIVTMAGVDHIATQEHAGAQWAAAQAATQPV